MCKIRSYPFFIFRTISLSTHPLFNIQNIIYIILIFLWIICRHINLIYLQLLNHSLSRNLFGLITPSLLFMNHLIIRVSNLIISFNMHITFPSWIVICYSWTIFPLHFHNLIILIHDRLRSLTSCHITSIYRYATK